MDLHSFNPFGVIWNAHWPLLRGFQISLKTRSAGNKIKNILKKKKKEKRKKKKKLKPNLHRARTAYAKFSQGMDLL